MFSIPSLLIGRVFCRYVLDRYIACLTGRSHMDLPEEEKRRMRLEKGENIDPNKVITGHLNTL